MKSNDHCPFCEGSSTKLILKETTFKIFECKNCGIASTHPAPSIPDYASMDFHSKANAANEDQLTSIKDLPIDWQNLIEKQIELIKIYFHKDSNILEIGCGEGILLDELFKHGFQNVEGIEPSRYAAIRGEKKELKIINAFFDPDKVTKKYDLVIMSHVFEHIEQPVGFLENISTILNPKGSIMLTQTNYKGLIPRWQKEKWYAWVPEQHFWHFTIPGLSKFMGTKNYHLIDSAYLSLVHPHDFIYKISKLKKQWIDQFIALYQQS